MARFGVGWIPWGAAAADLRVAIPQMHRALARLDHDATGLQIAASLRPLRDDGGRLDARRTIESVPRMVDAGATDIRLPMRLPTHRAAAEDVVSEVVDAFRSAVGRTGEMQ